MTRSPFRLGANTTTSGRFPHRRPRFTPKGPRLPIGQPVGPLLCRGGSVVLALVLVFAVVLGLIGKASRLLRVGLDSTCCPCDRLDLLEGPAGASVAPSPPAPTP